MNDIAKERKAFTLVEIIIAIAVFSIAVFVMYGVLSQIKKQKETFYKKYEKTNRLVELKRVIYQDFTNARDIKTDAKKDIALFKSTNSLYGITNPYILYILKNSTLYRVEYIKKLNTNLRGIDTRYLRVLTLLKKCKSFKINLSKDTLSIWIIAKKPIYMHIANVKNYTK